MLVPEVVHTPTVEACFCHTCSSFYERSNRKRKRKGREGKGREGEGKEGEGKKLEKRKPEAVEFRGSMDPKIVPQTKQHLTHMVIAKYMSKEMAHVQCIFPTGKCHDLSICELVATQSTDL